MGVKLNQQVMRPLIILFIAFILIYILTFLKSTSEKSAIKSQTQSASLIIRQVEPATHPVRITGQGVVQPAHRYQIIAEVTGNITEQATQLEAGSLLKKGELLCQLDPREYQYQLDRANLLAAQAASEVKKISSQSTIATNDVASDNTVLAEKQALLHAAEDAKALAQLNVDRTRIVAPCDGVILSDAIATGQVVVKGSQVAEFACTDHYQVVLLIPQEAIEYLGDATKLEQVAASVAGMSAKIVRILPELVDNTSLAQVLLTITNPLKQNKTLYFDQLVDAEILGQTVENSYLIPMQALQPDNRIWVVKGKNQLVMKAVKLINYQDNQVLVALNEGKAGESLQLVTSPPPAEAYDGMLIDTKMILQN
jgi:RND family efflux transporter MFP subunit